VSVHLCYSGDVSPPPLASSRFEMLAGETLDQLEAALSEVDDSLEVSLSMGVLTIEFEDGAKHVVNSHRAARQIWMSADATAWHFEWDGEAWVSTKTQEELWAVVQTKTALHLGRDVRLRAH
jgi:CyaY protein